MKDKTLIIASLDSPHLRTFYNLVAPLFAKIYIISDKKQSLAETLVVDFRFSKPLNALTNIKKIKKFINKINPSIVHVHQANSVGMMMGMAVNHKIPLVLTAWGSDVLLLPKQNFLKKMIAKRALSFANVITADADFMKDAIESLVKAKKIEITTFGISPLPYDPKEVIAVKENIIYSNRIHYSLYNINKIIIGLADFLHSNPEWKLVIAGNGDLTNELKVLAENSLPKKSYEFIGFVKQELNTDYYKRAKIWISIPNSDGTAVSLLEAMYYGCIPLVSDLPANHQWINDKGSDTNGIIASVDLSQDVLKACLLDSNKIGNYNYNLVNKKASMEACRKIFSGIYKSLI